ncbi:hypothetical protein PM076_05705 [Halorubrum ezzemoulense]|uniref:Uncharacterized protein n=1 Tax=Halorubrum ezzemoulense TaxID=337243 RepID=A0ABT4YY72_HALEZ|nr:hypothetical protein [Halorubrum ezzemoulense]MDB2245452.1 hypothetical protein [Halorubrum ezzemoulense]MDB2250338.1 hypothetical protein [Halorubrum ezzemoulense]MDB2279170.1 hypothetical protein [Halorubrum ezzemoulense]MDB2285594.1 hypothetical protein [Halorubrum ezzemoulense]MDB2287408.1 hypothetical protein [Halorubrum ezzemoulense]
MGVVPGDIDAAPGLGGLVHLLLIAWVCVTIAGAMPQFVSVWSGTTLADGAPVPAVAGA